MLISNFGRALGITRRIAKRLPHRAAGARARRDRRRAPRRARRRRSASTSTGWTASCTRSPTATRRRCWAASSSTGPWPDVAQAVQVSAYSLKSLTQACRPLMSSGGSVVGLTFDATVAWPAYDWMGVAKAGLESTSRYLARDLGAGRHPGQPGLRRPAADARRQGDPGLRATSRTCGPPGRRSAGTTPTTSRPPRRSCALLSDLFPAHHRRDRARRRRLPRDGCLTEFDSVPGVADEPASLVELRVLEGPNLYFPRAAIKLTLDIGGLAAVPEETARRFAQRIGLRNARPGEPDTGLPAAVRAAGGGPAGPGDRERVGRDPARRARAADQRPAPDRGGLPVAAPHPCAGDGHGGRGGARRGARRRRSTRW